MKPKTLVGFAAVTAVVTVAALTTVADRYWVSSAAVSERPFPGLLDHINDVTEIAIQSDTGTTIIERDGSGWVMKDKGGYPVQPEMARRAVIGIGELELTERKTTRPDRYERLGVGDLGGTDAKARLVTLKGAEGDAMAELIVGKRRDNRLSSGAGYYVREPGQEQAWFAPANFEIPTDPAIWLEPRIIHVNAKRVAQITTVQPDGETLVIAKESALSPHFDFKNLPPDKALKGEAVADDMATIITAIDLVDVAPESSVDYTGDVWHTDIKTFDGLDVKIDIVMRDQEPWARFSASAGDPLVDRPAQPDAVQNFLKTPEEVAAEADSINARTGGWAYHLQGHHGEKMKARLAIFLEDETALQGGGGADLGGFGSGSPPPDSGVPPGNLNSATE